MNKFFFKFKKPYFWAISPIFGSKTVFFPKTPALSPTTSEGFLTPSQNSEKSNDPIPIKHLDRRQDGRTSRLYFIGPLQRSPARATARGLTSATAVDWHLKGKDTECNV